MPNTIICGIDRSTHARAAARFAGALARRLGLSLQLIHVVDADRPSTSRPGLEVLRSVVREDVDLADVAIRLDSGGAAERLAAAAQGAEMLVVGTRGEGAIRQTLLGSVSGALTRAPSRPVIVLPPRAVERDEPFLGGRCVVCGVRDRRDIATAHEAATIAQRLGLALTLAHVLPASPPAAAGPPSDARLLGAAEVAELAEEMLNDVARSISANVPGDQEICVLEGATGPELEFLADSRHAAIVAVGSSERSPLDAALTGAASRHLMRRATRPVMICPTHNPAR
jgi:nucleotide-binding universal stress UspA family protein